MVHMKLDATGSDEEHVRQNILAATIVFGQYRGILVSSCLTRSYKVTLYKGDVLSKATFGCEAVDLTAITQRRYRVFNAKCLSRITRRSIQQEMRKPSFDLIAWIH